MTDSRSSQPKKGRAGASKKVANPPMLLKGGRVLDPSSDLDGVMDVLIEKGSITKVSKTITSKRAQIVDVDGRLVVPGLIDMHTHLREPGREDEETIESGTRAAVKGGFSAVCCMPNTEPPIDDQGTVRFILEKAEGLGKCSVHPVGAITKGRQGKELCEIGDLVMAGCVAVSDDGSPVMNGEIMRRALEYTRRFDIPVISHCEDTDMTRGWQMNEGFSSTRLGLKGYPPVAEEIMVARDIALCRYTGGRLHIAHLSTRGSLELVRKAKTEGVPVTCEVTPHHFTLNDELISSFDSSLKVNPPLRTEEDVEALIGGILDGTVDVIATDHAPHAFFEKEVEFTAAPFGMTGLETAVGLVLTELVKKRSIPLARVFACMGLNPARILNLRGGTLKPGSPADIAVIDLDRVWTVEEEQFESKSRNSPFIGRELEGQVWLTLVGGKMVYKDGAVLD
jgi:dihydroorotase